MKTTFVGKVKAYASEQNPLRTIVEFVLTDFQPNKNKQRIPKSEAENIITSALNMPIKINYENNRIKGHEFSIPIGTLSQVWAEDDAIMARSIIWKEEFPKIDEHLRRATSEGKSIGTSWEILYRNSTEDNGITDLHDCLVQATTIVDNPAYGERTRILSIAESLDYMDELEQMREKIFRFLEAFDTVYAEAVQQEIQKTAIDDMESVLDKIKSLVASLQASKAEVETKLQEAETLNTSLKVELEDKITVLQSRVTELETEKADAEKQRADAEVLENRLEALKELGVTLDKERVEKHGAYYLSMSEEAFESYKDAIRSVSRSVVSVPDSISSPSNLSAREIAENLKKLEKEGKN